MTLVLLLAVASSIAASTNGDGSRPPAEAAPRQHLETVLEGHPELPVLLPEEVPDGYEFWPSSALSSADGELTATWVFRPRTAPDAEHPVIGLCVLHGDLADLDELCHLEGREPLDRLEHAGYAAAIVPLGTPGDDAAVEVWLGVEFTDSWQDVAWIDG